MKKTLIALIVLLFAGWQLYSGPVDTTTARTAGQAFMNQHLAYGNTGALRLCHQATDDSQQICFYVFNRDEGGFVIVSADDRCVPILGYSMEGSFDATLMSENLRWWLSGYQKSISEVARSTVARTSEISQQWEQLLTGTAVAPHRDVVVSPLLVTNWSQSPYYNALCPTNSDGQAITGCAATAMGQIMRYWEHPSQGNGHHGYPCNNAQYGYGDYGWVEADFGNTTYDFSLMPERLTSSSSQAEVNEVAKLLFHCGVCINMSYGPNASGANIENAPAAMRSYFGYSPSTVYYRGNNSGNWVNMLKQELNSQRPVYYAGYGPDGGHAFVCDGYDDQDYFHFNWGWQGHNNGYFAVTSLNPSYDFTEDQCAIFGLEPDPCYPYEAIEISGNCVMSYQGDEVTLTAPAGVSYQWSNNESTQSITVSPIVPTLYTVTVTDENGCANTTSQWVSFADGCELTIIMHDSYGDGWQGNRILIYNNVKKIAEATFTEGYTDTLTFPVINGELAFKWREGNFSSECSFEIYTNGIEYISPQAPSPGIFYIDTLACNNNVGICPMEQSDNQWLIYPNPAKEVLHIQRSTVSDVETQLQITDIYGRIIIAQKITDDDSTIKLSSLSSGIYLIRLTQENGDVKTVKIVKQ